MFSFRPYTDQDDEQAEWVPKQLTTGMEVADAPGVWKLAEDKRLTAAASLWSVQATAPLPLEAINDLMMFAVDENSPQNALSGKRWGNCVWVNEDFFKSKPSGITSSVGQDVMGFLSLVLTYAKSTSQLSADNSVKSLSSIMPRTNFVTMYASIKSKLGPKLSGSSGLYNLVKTLACYENKRHDANEIDTL